MERTSRGWQDYLDPGEQPRTRKRRATVGADPAGDLFAPVVPAARVTDPATSNEAIHDVIVRAGSQQWKLLLAYGSRPLGLTAEDAAEIAGLNRVGVSYWKRIGELLHAGLLEDTFKTQQASTGSEQRVLALSAKGRRAIK